MAFSTVLTRNDLQNVLAHINLGDDAHKEITQAEFDALTDEEKDDGTIYFITDGISKNIFLDDNTPVGAIMPYGGDSDPAYWLICDGRAVSRTAYAELFAVIGTTYGTGDGSTTFNLPNLKGKVAIGSDTGYNLGDSGGEAVHTLNQNEIPNYNIGFHPVAPAYHTQYNNGGFIGTSIAKGSHTSVTNPSSTSGNVQYGYNVYTNGGGQAHNNMQPYLVTNYIIKTSSAAQKEQSNIDLFYPVGSCYETTDSEFDPSIRWGGVWERTGSTIVDDYNSTTIEDILVPGPNVNIITANYSCKNGIAQLYIRWSNKTTISANNDGNITNITIGTLVAGKRPIYSATGTSYGDEGGPAFYIAQPTGQVDMGAAGGTGAARTIAVGTFWGLGMTYVVGGSHPTLYTWHRIG